MHQDRQGRGQRGRGAAAERGALQGLFGRHDHRAVRPLRQHRLQGVGQRLPRVDHRIGGADGLRRLGRPVAEQAGVGVADPGGEETDLTALPSIGLHRRQAVEHLGRLGGPAQPEQAVRGGHPLGHAQPAGAGRGRELGQAMTGGGRVDAPFGLEQGHLEGGPLRVVGGAVVGQAQQRHRRLDLAAAQQLVRGRGEHRTGPLRGVPGGHQVPRHRKRRRALLVEQTGGSQVQVGQGLRRELVEHRLAGSRMREPAVVDQPGTLEAGQGPPRGRRIDLGQAGEREQSGRPVPVDQRGGGQHPPDHRVAALDVAAQGRGVAGAGLHVRTGVRSGSGRLPDVRDHGAGQQRIAAGRMETRIHQGRRRRCAEGFGEQFAHAVARQRGQRQVIAGGQLHQLGVQLPVGGLHQLTAGEDHQDPGPADAPDQIQQAAQ